MKNISYSNKALKMKLIIVETFTNFNFLRVTFIISFWKFYFKLNFISWLLFFFNKNIISTLNYNKTNYTEKSTEISFFKKYNQKFMKIKQLPY